MIKTTDNEPKPRPAGYLALAERYEIRVPRNWHRSRVAESKIHRIDTKGRFVDETYPRSYWPGEKLSDHFEFALKYDGINLAILDTLFHQPVETELLAYIKSKPTGKYARQLWFLYEFLTGKTLPLDDLKRGNYIDLLSPKKYYTLQPAQRARRQRINNNLLGNPNFCPTVRRMESLRDLETANLADRCRDVVSGYSSSLIRRALSYLYTRETKSSFAIENVDISGDRIARFMALLQQAEQEDFCEETRLVTLQNRIVPDRFGESKFRDLQNYVGETVFMDQERIHYVCPKPEDLASLMDGLIAAHQRIESGSVHPAVHAAAIAYGFVFIHPFEDGNGRIHRFLIHNILARRGFTPEGLMFPVSATMLRNNRAYDDSLEAFSRELTSLTNYYVDNEGHMTVYGDTARWYRYIDMTAQAEALFRFIEQTIETELPQELAFLASYDTTKRSLRGIVDMPDRKLDLFTRCCLQNNGRISARKRALFDYLTDEETKQMEYAVQTGYSDYRVKEMIAAYGAEEAD